MTGNSLEFSHKAAQKGWIGLTWPKEYGGQGRSYIDCLILQKIWTSGGRFVNYFYVLARTDPEAPKHLGISECIFPANLLGITRIHMIDITGTEAWNDVFFDEVRVPKRYLVGEKNRGFLQVLHQLDYERSRIERLMGNYPLFEAIIQI